MRFLCLPGVSAGEGCFTSPMGSPNHPSIMRSSPYAFAEPFRPFPYESGSRSAVHSPRKNPIGDKSHHRRCPSESITLEKPAWFDDLLSEPDNTQMPVKGHRRSSSDSAYLSILERKTRNANKEKSKLDNCIFAEPQILVSDDEDMWKGSMKKNQSSPDNLSSEYCEFSLTLDICSTSADGSPRSASSLLITKMHNHEEDVASPQQDVISGESCFSPSEQSVLKGVDKRTKQCRQSAHRSRIRKLQYIAELERDIQVLQAEGSEFSTALEFLNQQKFMLDMENRALRQQLDTLSQEHMIQNLEQEMLEKEVARLRALYQIQMQQQPKRHPKKNRDQLHAPLTQAVYHN